jgi:hypothetical protein
MSSRAEQRCPTGKSRQADAITMLDHGMILDLTDAWQLDLKPTQELCEVYGKALVAGFGRPEIGGGSAFLSLRNSQFPNLLWLREGGCDLDGPIAETLRQMHSDVL